MYPRNGVFVIVLSLITLVSAEPNQISTDVERAQMLEARLAAREKVYPPASDVLLMMVGANSSLLGCAMRQCDYMRPDWDNPQYFTVCQYKPADNASWVCAIVREVVNSFRGNYYEKQPYTYGASYSKCPKGHSCFRNQCVKKPTCRKVQPTSVLKDPKDRILPECVFWKED
ncbi:unnamed protein product [Taenia asiatica]|uniref:SCP domain-containing protein n=1 Tax=Taenia asiatica TaxID=60517 RepID=A0A0R3WF14_TAEAS|nr:unnamed protein product [Taenia asiatica]